MAGLFQVYVAYQNYLARKCWISLWVFSQDPKLFKRYSFLPWGNFLTLGASELLSFLRKASSRHFLPPCSLFYEFSHGYPSNFHQGSAQSFTNDCSTTISEWTPGFPGHSDAANCLQTWEPLQPETASPSEMENVRDHQDSLQEPGRHCMNKTWVGLKKINSRSSYKSAHQLHKAVLGK